MIEIIVVAGVEGPSLYVNNYRICGNKPWGGGKQTHIWKVKPEELLKDIKHALPASAAPVAKVSVSRGDLYSFVDSLVGFYRDGGGGKAMAEWLNAHGVVVGEDDAKERT